jgi:rhodanese-related sulfurtransferase
MTTNSLPTPLIIDVREPFEYASGHVNGALNIPPSKLMAGAMELDDVPKDHAIVLYCHTGSRTNVSMHILNSLGFTNLTNGINRQQVERKLGL